jgi:hypothetical protein
MDILFDIVIPVGPNDKNVIVNMVNTTKQNVIGYRNIYLVSYDPNIIIEGCIVIDENIFPFNKEIISTYIGKNERIGWYLQQLIKLYASLVIKDILSNYLVIDSDTYFLRPVTFFSNRKPLYNYGTEYHLPYFDHMTKLHPTLTKQTQYSGICHHMMFQRKIIEQLFELVQTYHNTEFYKAFLQCINKKDILGSGASEYEIYFNFLHIYQKDNFIIRKFNWENTSQIVMKKNIDYISCHWYMR